MHYTIQHWEKLKLYSKLIHALECTCMYSKHVCIYTVVLPVIADKWLLILQYRNIYWKFHGKCTLLHYIIPTVVACLLCLILLNLWKIYVQLSLIAQGSSYERIIMCTNRRTSIEYSMYIVQIKFTHTQLIILYSHGMTDQVINWEWVFYKSVID